MCCPTTVGVSYVGVLHSQKLELPTMWCGADQRKISVYFYWEVDIASSRDINRFSLNCLTRLSSASSLLERSLTFLS